MPSRSRKFVGPSSRTAASLLSLRDRSYIRRALEDAIAAFEPRLDRVRITVDDPQSNERVLRFRVEGWLRIEPVPEPVAFDTVLQLTTREYVVQGRD